MALPAVDYTVIDLRDAIRIGPAVARSFEAGPDGMELLVLGPSREGDAEMLPGFWEG